jgi:hypothetical protein
MARATLVDEREEVLNDDEEVGSLDTQDTVEGQEVAQEEEPQQDIPEKYRGKSMEEIVKMHQEAEKLLGKQSSEVGQLRSVVDEYIQAQLSNQQAPVQQQEEDDVDFFVDPEKAVARAIENHPKIKEAEAYTAQNKRQTALSQLQSKHPEMQEILNDNGFAEWVKGSKIRTQLFVQADQAYDYDAADELFSLWKERAGVAKQTVEVEKQARKQQLKSANTGNARGTGEGSRKKVYRRADIIKLMKTDPERYSALSEEIFQAYAEGRVK